MSLELSGQQRLQCPATETGYTIPYFVRTVATALRGASVNVTLHGEMHDAAARCHWQLLAQKAHDQSGHLVMVQQRHVPADAPAFPRFAGAMPGTGKAGERYGK